MKKATSQHKIKNLLQRRLIITAVVSIAMLVGMAILAHLTMQKLGRLNEVVSQQALPLFESTLEFEVNIKGVVLGASKYAHQPIPAHKARLEDSYNDIQQVLPQIMLLKEMGHPDKLEDLLQSLEQIYHIGLEVIRLTDDIAQVEQNADTLLHLLDELQEPLITADGSIIETHIDIIERVNLLKSVLIRIQGYHSGQSLSGINLTSLEEALLSEKIDSDIEGNISILSKDIIDHYQKLKELDVQRDKQLKTLFQLRNHTDYLLDDVLQPDAKQAVVDVDLKASDLIEGSSNRFFIVATIGISILFILTIMTIREFIKILSEFFQVMEQLGQGDFSVRVDKVPGGKIAADVRNSLNGTLEKLQALTVVQPYTDTLWKSTSAGLLLIEPNGKILRANEAMQKILKVEDIAAIKGKMFMDYFPSVLLKPEGMQESRNELISSKGKAIPVILSIEPVYSSEGGRVLQGYFCAITDLRPDFQIKKQLHEQTEGLRAVLDTVTDAIVVIDADSKIIFSSAKTEKLFGYRNENLLQEHLNLILPEWTYKVYEGDNTTQVSLTNGRDLRGHSLPLEVSVGSLVWQGKRALVLAIQTLAESRGSKSNKENFSR